MGCFELVVDVVPERDFEADQIAKQTRKVFVTGEPCIPAPAIIDDGSADTGIASSNFRDGRGMVPSVVVMNSGGSDANVDVDWIRCAQFFPNGDERAPAV